jgi:putative membrane protein
MAADGDSANPRIYLAAERTFLAWIRTALALMAFGFVVARFPVLLRELAIPTAATATPASGLSLGGGLGLITSSVVVRLVAPLRRRRYVRAIDDGRFRTAFGSAFALAPVLLLAFVGVTMTLVLSRL